MGFLLPTTRKEAETIIKECEEMLKNSSLPEKKRVSMEINLEYLSLEQSTERLIKLAIRMTKIVLY